MTTVTQVTVVTPGASNGDDDGDDDDSDPTDPVGSLHTGPAARAVTRQALVALAGVLVGAFVLV